MEEKKRSYVSVLLPAQRPDGEHIMAAVVKRTYDIGPAGDCRAAERQDPLIGSDRFYGGGDPVTSSCLTESDYIPYKLLTDVVVIAKAYSPHGKPAREMEATLSIGDTSKTIRVFGDRVCRYRPSGNPVFGDPELFTEMEIRYESAYGGVDLFSFGQDAPMIYPRNPLGKGFVVENKEESVDGLQLPNLEDPRQLLTPENIVTGQMEKWQKQPMPQGFGWYGKLWYPRCSFAGVLPAYMSIYEEIREAALGLVPEDQVEQFKKFKMPLLDFKFFNGAAPGLALPYLKGNEIIRMANLDPAGSFELELPGDKPRIGIDLGDGIAHPEVFLTTVCILKEENKLYQVWRAAVDYPGPDRMDAVTKMDLIIEEE